MFVLKLIMVTLIYRNVTTKKKRMHNYVPLWITYIVITMISGTKAQ